MAMDTRRVQKSRLTRSFWCKISIIGCTPAILQLEETLVKNKKFITALLAAISLFFVSAAFARDSTPRASDSTKLLETRQSDIWIEGTRFGDDMIIGSRASLQIIYVDSEFANTVNADSRVQQWARMMVQYYGSDATRGKALFIAHLETFKPCDFDPQNLFVGKYHLQKGDALSPSMTNPFGSLDSGLKGFFAFVVPASELKKGAEIQIGYGDDSVLWKVPR